MSTFITTDLECEVRSQIGGYRRFNRVFDIHIQLYEEKVGIERIKVKYIDFHRADGSEVKVDKKYRSYNIIPNPNGLPLTPPENDPDAVLFDVNADEYYKWMNDTTGQAIATAVLAKFIKINGAPA